MMKPARGSGPFSYRELTANTYRAMKMLMDESRRRQGYQAIERREWAYGMYLGWRALVIDRADPIVFKLDDEMLEALLTS